MNSHSRSMEEKKLDFFTGDWSNSGQVLPGPFGPGGPATGETSYHWDVGGKWLLYVSRLKLPGLGTYEVHGGVAFNSRAGRYDAYAVNNLGNLLVYEGEWTDDATLVFTRVHPKSTRKARVVYQKQPDGSIKMTSENAAEEGQYETHFEVSFAHSSGGSSGNC